MWDEYDSYDYDAAINLAGRETTYPVATPLPSRRGRQPEANRPYARSTSVAPSDVRPSLGDQRLTMADDCSQSRTAARSAPVPMPASDASVVGPGTSRNRGGCFSRAQNWLQCVCIWNENSSYDDDAEINMARPETT